MLPILLLFAYALYCCGEDYRKSATLRVLFTSAAVLTAVSCPWMLLHVAPDYTVPVEQWTVLFTLLYMTLSVVTLIALFRNLKKLTREQPVDKYIS